MKLITCTSWDHARREAAAWLVSDTTFLVLFGNPGTGKTTLVGDLTYPPVHTRQHRDITTHWQDAPWTPSSEPQFYRMVCVDDVKAGIKGKYAATGAEVLGNLIDDVEAHHEHRLILTTNLDAKALAEMLDAGARDRISGHGWWIQFKFASFRGSSAERKASSRPTAGVSPLEAYKLYRHAEGGFVRLVSCNSVAERWEVRRFTKANPSGVALWLTSDEIRQSTLEPFEPEIPDCLPWQRAAHRTMARYRELGADGQFWEDMAKANSRAANPLSGPQRLGGVIGAGIPAPLLAAYAQADPDGHALYLHRLGGAQ